ncbi:hypothetical protein Bbelb_221580 [Branchiostoma belcheri]|nr:hypothetical protein Bbelb_221580 [Branchiostoma belcheri]
MTAVMKFPQREVFETIVVLQAVQAVRGGAVADWPHGKRWWIRGSRLVCMYFACEVGDVLHGYWWTKGTGGGKARRKLVLGEPQPCPEETDLDDTLELEELLQLLKDGEDQPPARPSTPTDQRDTNTFGKGGSVETLRRAQNVVNAEASTSFTPGIVGGEEPPSRQNTNDSGSDLFTGGFHTSLGENSTEVRLPLHDNVFITAVQAVRGGAVGDVLHGDWWKVCECWSETCIKWQQKLARNQSLLRRQNCVEVGR